MTTFFALMYFIPVIYAHVVKFGDNGWTLDDSGWTIMYLFSVATVASFCLWLIFIWLSLRIIGRHALSLPSSRVAFYTTMAVAGCLTILIILAIFFSTPSDLAVNDLLLIIGLSVATIFVAAGLYMAKLNYDATHRLPLVISLTIIQLVFGIFLTIIILVSLTNKDSSSGITKTLEELDKETSAAA